jgi:hypothetical protein
MAATHWHQLHREEVLRLLDVDLATGLAEDEVRRRRAKFGPNRLSARRGTPAWVVFARQFHQPLVYILLVAVVVTAGLGEWVDSAVIFGVVFINAIVGYLQESKAEHAIASLARMTTTETTVRRGGVRRRLSAEALVPGDVVLLDAGDRVPADLRLFRVRSLQIDESALTGESVPVHKHSDALALDTVLADRRNLAFTGTLVAAGSGEGVVWATGDATETGHIARLIAEAVDLSTPLTRKIAAFSRLSGGTCATRSETARDRNRLFIPLLRRQPIDLRCRVRGAEAVVDIHHGDSAPAGGEHAEQRGDAAEARAVTDARGHGDHGPAHQPGHGAGQRSFHAGDDDEHVARFEPRALREQSMDSGHAYIGDALDLVAKDFERHSGFVRDRQIRRSGAHNADRAGEFRPRLDLDRDAPRTLVVPRDGKLRGHGGELLRRGAAHQQHTLVFQDLARDGRDVRRLFARAENDFGKSATPASIGIDPRKTEIDASLRHHPWAGGSCVWSM